MAILRSMDGQFYNVPDSQLNAMLVPADEVKTELNAAEANSSLPEGAQNAADMVTPHGRRGGWRNCWSRNYWRNGWRNCY